MTDENPDVRVHDNPDAARYEVSLDGKLAGFVTYRDVPGRIVFLHAEIDPTFEGNGLGSRLAAGALGDARARGLQVEPRCPFIAAYIGRHPAYADLVVPGSTG